jgi:hypothetical protein
MATTAAPYGARPIGTLSASGSFTGKVRHLPIGASYGTQISNGDFVKLVADGEIEKDVGTTALTAVGIFMGCSYTDPTTNQKTFSTFWPASNAATDAMAYVIDDPFVVFQMQADEAMNTTDRGLNASIDFVDGPNSLPPKGTTASDAYPDVIVKFNAASSGSASNHSYLNATGV